ncbi:MAG: AzlC family ABC transporter permease [Bacillota bacterium]|nr:AzlC family ABC transporter permease [Bacillota bacterium]MDW7676871.1 AzlC family ABC transporter permease [Bacillota bacterium]
MKKNRDSMLQGAKMIMPILLGVIPFAMITGITAVNTGMSPRVALFMSVFIFAGASQLAAMQLIYLGAPALVIIYTSLIINFRFMIYSLSIAPYFKNESALWKALLSYMMTDQSYALSLVHFMNHPDENPKWFFLGASLNLWLVWQAATIAGLILGSLIPSQLGLDFAIPLTFTAVLFKSIDDFAVVAAVLFSAFVAVAAAQMPLNSSLILAAIAGIAAGSMTENILSRRKEASDHE